MKFFREHLLDDEQRAVKLLRILLWVYIGLCLLIAGLNFGYADQAPPETAALITWIWHAYENWVKTAFIVIGSLLTLAIVRGTGKKQQNRTHLRKRNLIGFTCCALAVHIALPLVLDNPDIYFYAMPLLWTTIPLQSSVPLSEFFQRHEVLWGTSGIYWALVFFWTFSALALAGTLVIGRRWFCSSLCLFNGFAAEVFDPVMPLIRTRRKKKRKKSGLNRKALAFFARFRWVYFGIALLFTGYWALLAFGRTDPGTAAAGSLFSQEMMHALASFETWKYLGLELMFAMFFWIAFIGRGYCLYCPVGTFFGLISRIAGQRIVTNETTCISCGACVRACPVGINVQSFAETGKPVRLMNCVGCGHCVDACPTGTLRYTTKPLEFLRAARGKPGQLH